MFRRCNQPLVSAFVGWARRSTSSVRRSALAGSDIRMAKQSSTKKVLKATTEQLGPGLITGAADDDPSGIATYSQAGAQFGFSLLWTVFLTTPFMIAIQLVSAE